MLATAESCSGGWIAQAVTAIPGSSSWFDRGFVTYSDISKTEMLGVRQATLQRFGAVSKEVVDEMATGALRNSKARLSVAVSGIAGPAGATAEKAVGTVYFAWALDGMTVKVAKHLFGGDREEVRYQSVVVALNGIIDLCSGSPLE